MDDNEQYQEGEELETKQEDKKKKTYSEEEVQNLIRKRVKSEREAIAKKLEEQEAKESDYKTRIAELESKSKATEPPVTAADDTTQTQTTTASSTKQNQNHIPADMLPAIIEHQNKVTQFEKNLKEAMDKDEEFKKLAQPTNELGVPDVVVSRMMHLDNAPAVAKHLLKNKKDNELMKVAMRGGDYDLVRFINDLSDKLESNASKPGPSTYKSAPTFTDVGDAGEDFDLEDHISKLP